LPADQLVSALRGSEDALNDLLEARQCLRRTTVRCRLELATGKYAEPGRIPVACAWRARSRCRSAGVHWNRVVIMDGRGAGGL
jgi:hypothetical protein